MAVNVLRVVHERLAELWREIDDSDGIVTPEQEAELSQLLAEQDGLFEQAQQIVQLKESIETGRRWISEHRELMRRYEARLDSEKARLTEALERNGTKSTKNAFVRMNVITPKGRVDPNSKELESESSVGGYTSEQVDKSGIPRAYFVPHTVYKLNKDLVRQALEQKREVGPARIVVEKYTRITRLAQSKDS